MPLHTTHKTMRAATALLLLAIAAPALAAQSNAPSEAPVPVGTGAPVGFGPNGATLRCRDGFLPAPGAPDAACAERGGVAARYPLRRRPLRAEAAATNAAARSGATAQSQPARPDSGAKPAGFESYAQRRARADSINAAIARPPQGATLQCGDGTWIVNDTTTARCAARGGVRVSLPRQP